MIIKIRAWDKEQKIMRDWNYFFEYDLRKQILFDCILEKQFPYLYAFGEPKSLIPMLYLNINDLNDVEVYENDIVLTEDNKIGIVKYGIFESSHEGGQSRYHFHLGFHIVDKNGNQLWDTVNEDIDIKKLKVIGNTFENNNLLN